MNTMPAADFSVPATGRQRLLVWSFFVGLLLLGCCLVRSYGISVDEPLSRANGMTSLKYVGNKFFPSFIQSHPAFERFPTPLHEYKDRDYGVGFEGPVSFLEQLLPLHTDRNVYWFRHLCTFLVCFGGVVAVYHLARRRFADWRLGLLAALLLVLSPRLFADSFYNDKDAVFMALFAVATNTAVAFIGRPTWRRACWHALACALTIDVRIMGVMLPLATLVLLALEAARGSYRGQRIGLKTSVYIALLVGLVLAMWPYLWTAPLQNFRQVFANMAKFRWGSDVLYAGQLIPAPHLPWHYLPVWIGITTPILYLVGFVVGTGLILRQLVRRHWRLYATANEWQDLLFLGLALAPVLAIIALHSIVYDGWRQIYFIYPALLLVAMSGLVALGQWRPTLPSWLPTWKRLSRGVLVLSLLATAVQMVAMHPMQNVYFNLLPGRHLEQRFELDYWVLSYKMGLEWIVQHDKRPHIKISSQMNEALGMNRIMLPEDAQQRLEIVPEFNDADYYLTTYRWHPQPYLEFESEAANFRAGGQRILSIFRVKK